MGWLKCFSEGYKLIYKCEEQKCNNLNRYTINKYYQNINVMGEEGVISAVNVKIEYLKVRIVK